MFVRFACAGLIVVTSLLTATPPLQAEESKEKEKEKTVAVFSLDRPLLEAPVGDDPFFGSVGAETLKDLVERLEKAKENDDVVAVVVLLGNTGIGWGQLEELHSALTAIRSTGKPVYAHANSLTYAGWALLSASSRLSVTPVGELFITGIYGEQIYLRGLLDKIHVQPDFLTCGAYKSAGEIYTRRAPSPEAEEMYDWLYDGIYDNSLKLIASGRGQTTEVITKWVDGGIYSAKGAAKQGIIDAVEYRKDFVSFVKQKVGDDAKWDQRFGKQKRKTIDLSNPFAVFKVWSDILQPATKSSRETKPSVAIVYVEGPIMPGKSQPTLFGVQGIAYSDPIRKALDKAADDDSVKAVVLRVNSPGGSAVGSEIILQATKRVAEKKPLVVSMGNIAGSGGYYVACGANTIIADASTITGSIGVVAGKLGTRPMWEAVGIHWHPIARGKNSGMLSSSEVFTEEQRQMLQAWMDEIYEDFKSHVTQIRGERLTKPIEEMAGGRVYTGEQAVELGLVDRIGTLQDAIRHAAEQAKLEEYDVRVLPRPKSVFEQMMADLTGETDEAELKTVSRVASTLKTRQVWNAAATLLQTMEPWRAQSLQRALVQLEIMQREGVSLAMPEIVVAP